MELGREFLNEGVTNVGGFETAASAIKEHTHTNVNLHFGESVILSSLSETLNAYFIDKTPGIGDIPLFRLVFGRKELFRQNVSLLILITPREPAGFKNNRRIPDGEVADIYRYVKKLIEPTTNLSVITKELAKLPLYTQDKLFSNALYSAETIQLAMNTTYNQMDEY